MGFVRPVIGALGQANEYSAKGRQALIAGQAQQNAANAKATAKEQASKRELHQVAENMKRTSSNKRRDMGAARAGQASSGFTQEGSNTKGEEMTQKIYSQELEDMARGGSVASMNSLNEQVALRRAGDAAMFAARAESEQYMAMAKATRTAAWMNAVGGLVGAAGGAFDAGYGLKTPMSDWGRDEWGYVAGKGIYGGDAGAGLVTAFNPFAAKYASRTWEANLMDLFGMGKLK